jgi:hypothetical protein
MTITQLNKLLTLEPYAFNRTKRGWSQYDLKHQIIILTAYILRYVKNNKWLPDVPKGINEETPIDVRMNLARCLARSGDSTEAIMQYEQCQTGRHHTEAAATIAFLNNDRQAFDAVEGHSKLMDAMKANWTATYEEITKSL